MARIEYVGHATVLIEMNGVRVLTDPLLRNRVVHLRRAVGVDATALGGVDVALISHLHFDHLDIPSLRCLGKDIRIVVPRGAARLLHRKGFREVTEVSAGEELSIGSLRVTATPAHHDERRRPFGVRAEPLGYLVRSSSSVYFAGDTDLFDGMAEIGPVDVVLIPIAGWGPALGPGHMDAERAAQALPLLRPRVAVPIHWGTYYPFHLGLISQPRFLDLPPALFLRHAAQLAPDVEVRVLHPGEETSFP
jgi:L-ascorbate metabolism protein UlaG (beta-lactamase superfamily)